MIVLDTNVLSEVTKPSPHSSVLRWLSALNDETSITAVTAAELRAGLSAMPHGHRKTKLSEVVIAQLSEFEQLGSVLPFDHFAAVEYATVLALRKAEGKPISPQDAMIAAICRSHGAPLATRNVGDFEHTGVEVINPWAQAGTPDTTK